jgi:hypothetical protein
MNDQIAIIPEPEQMQIHTNPIVDIKNVFQDKGQFDTVLRGAMALSKSTIVPNTYQNKPENCFIAINLANRMVLTQ